MKKSAALYIQETTQTKVVTQTAANHKEWVISFLCVACLPLIYIVGKFFMSL
ncbi:MAG: hypothetical protein AAFO07_34305 [Bacteroidota bacterium]